MYRSAATVRSRPGVGVEKKRTAKANARPTRIRRDPVSEIRVDVSLNERPVIVPDTRRTGDARTVFGGAVNLRVVCKLLDVAYPSCTRDYRNCRVCRVACLCTTGIGELVTPDRSVNCREILIHRGLG